MVFLVLAFAAYLAITAGITCWKRLRTKNLPSADRLFVCLREFFILRNLSLKPFNIWDKTKNNKIWLAVIVLCAVDMALGIITQVPYAQAMAVSFMMFPAKIIGVMIGKICFIPFGAIKTLYHY